PVAVVPRAAENDAVAPRKHVAAAEVAIVDLGLRQQDFELTTHRLEFRIIKQLARTESGAVENNRLAQPRDLTPAAKLFHHHTPARDVEIAQQRAEIDRRFDEHRRVLPHEREAEVVFGIAMNLARGVER